MLDEHCQERGWGVPTGVPPVRNSPGSTPPGLSGLLGVWSAMKVRIHAVLGQRVTELELPPESTVDDLPLQTKGR